MTPETHSQLAPIHGHIKLLSRGAQNSRDEDFRPSEIVASC